jgi:hypothetical protein
MTSKPSHLGDNKVPARVFVKPEKTMLVSKIYTK